MHLKTSLYILFTLLSFGLFAQEFPNIQRLAIPLEFKPSALDIPKVSFGIEIPKQNFTLTYVGIPKESNLPKEIDMRSIIEGERNRPRREVYIQSLASFQNKDTRKPSVISIEARAGNPYGDRFNQRGIENISYKDSRTPLYISPYRRTSIWDY